MSDDLPLIDLRTYTIAVRKMPEFLDAFDRLAMPILVRHLGTPLFLTTSAVGRLNQFVHAWGYADMGDLERRHAVRDKDPDWPAYLAATVHLVTAQETQIVRRVRTTSRG